MRRLVAFALHGSVLTRVALLGVLVVGAAFASTIGRAKEHARTASRVQAAAVVNLSQASATARPQEDVGAGDLAAVERKIRSRSGGASADDGISPGAPSDAEVRRDLRRLKAELSAAGSVRRGAGDLIWPVRGPLTSPFGMRWGRLHAGLDIAAAGGTPIRAAASGSVILMAPTGGYGNYTCVRHRAPVSTCYAHQSRFGTSVGASVRQGDVIGFVGNTGHSFGNHLHFEVRIDGRPVDPMGYL